MARCVLPALAVACMLAPARAGEPPPAAPAEKPEEPKKYGGMLIYKQAQKIIIEGYVCLDTPSALEWGVVARGGKEYESVLAVDVRPSDFHLALLAIGYREGGGVERQGDPRVPAGDRLVIHVQWEKDGQPVTKRLEELVWEEEKKRPMEQTSFAFTGSLSVFDKESGKVRYIADEEKIIAALYRDPTAVLNNPLPTGTDDISYTVHKDAVPPAGTRVTVTFSPVPKEEPAEAVPLATDAAPADAQAAGTPAAAAAEPAAALKQ